jgi:acyl carrier protein
MTTTEPELTALVRGTWEQVLGNADFTDEDPFFVVGGHSLAAIRVMTALSTAVGVRLPVRLLFRNRSIDTLVPAVAGYVADQASAPSAVEPVPATDPAGG